MNDFRETLYTLDRRGQRKWVYSSVVYGFWYKRRAVVAYTLMLFYLLMPWLTINGQQGIWIDIAHRRFVFFGHVFWATDTIFVVLLLTGLAFSLFFFSALLGRIWCGWACPETVFLEFLFRPIERLIEGSPAQRLRLDQQPWSLEKLTKKLTKHGLCALFAWLLATTTLAYLLGREPLLRMLSDWPWNNSFHFVLTLIMMGLLGFQFGWFREQFCTILCPYARFQSVLLDTRSLIVGYDKLRGEPRGKLKKQETEKTGDCIDCGLCVRVCPTGIDIRNGTQMECIHCTACMDACDSIMHSIGRPLGLIRYDNELGFNRNPRSFLRPRLFVYLGLLAIICATFLYLLKNRSYTDFQVLRGGLDEAYTITPEGSIINHLHARIGNKKAVAQVYSLDLCGEQALGLVVPQPEITVPPEGIVTMPVFISVQPELLSGGRRKVEICLRSTANKVWKQEVTLLGPG